MGAIWVVENDLSTQRLLVFLLQQDGHDVEAFADAPTVISRLLGGHPDLVVLDLGLDDHDGLEICRFIKESASCRDLPVVIVTGRLDTMDRYRSLALGVDDFLTKPVDNLEFILRVRNRLRRSHESPLPDASPRWLEVGELALDLANHELHFRERTVSLTPSEFSILEALMRHPDRALAVETLLVESLGYPPDQGNPDVLRTHVRNLRAKVEVDPAKPQVILTVPRLGYRIGAYKLPNSEKVQGSP